MKQRLTRKELTAHYIRTAWVLKIRLMSSRRLLWDTQVSLIHVESALLQIRKACEAICYLCVIAAELEDEAFKPRLRKSYRVGEVLKGLSARGNLWFPGLARRTERTRNGDQTVWQLDLTASEQTDIDRLGKLHSLCGQLLHEFSPFLKWPASDPEAQHLLGPMLNQCRSDHQWLWNRFWHHFVTIRGALLCVDLGDQSEASQPFVIKQDTLLDDDVTVEFAADFVADFTGKVDWSLYDPKSRS